MSTSISPGFVTLHSQHTLQHTDWLVVYTLANQEGVGEHLDSYDFDDFLGLAVYLFITSQSQDTRKQLSQLFPKFGSAIVLPLVKILCKQDIFVEQSIPVLAKYSLTKMAPYSLAIGLNQVLTLKIQNDLKTVALQTFRQLLQSCEPSVQLVLSQLLSEKNRQLVSDFSASQQLSSHKISTAKSRQHSAENTERKAMQCA
ncbi:MAG: hypothetical protein AAF821_25250 [Cyanobacteria bacterium P01_D01_bin.156]